MAHGMAGHSVADITHHLKGIHFPAQKQDVVQQAKSNGAKGGIMQVPDAMPDQEYATTAQVMKAAGGMGAIQGWQHLERGDTVPVDMQLDAADAGRYGALVLPGGVINPDQLWLHPRAIAFIRNFVQTGKPIAAICHGPWTLIDAEGVSGRRMTSWPSLRADLTNAGAHWVDEEVVTDRGLVTSRKPDNIPAFNQAMIAAVRGARQTPRGTETEAWPGQIPGQDGPAMGR